MWLAVSGRRTMWNKKSGGARNRKLVKFSQDCCRFCSGSKQPKIGPSASRNLLHLIGNVMRDESSPFAQFGAAALSGLRTSSTAREGESAAYAGQLDPRKSGRESLRETRAQPTPARGAKLQNNPRDIPFALSRVLPAENDCQ